MCLTMETFSSNEYKIKKAIVCLYLTILSFLSELLYKIAIVSFNLQLCGEKDCISQLQEKSMTFWDKKSFSQRNALP